MGKSEQIGNSRRYVNVDGKAVKKATSKARRRAAKKDLENAPKRNEYKGYVA